ncbi:MAG TPA: hypothetical protein VGV87_25420 [Blastocatellia bacterium]|nr:hypothetical protein [Blastocatellia bacterium]
MRNQTSFRIIVGLLALQFFTSLCWAQHDHASSDAKPGMLLPGMGEHHHPISTKSPEAQKFFDQGLTLVYGFNRSEAIRSFSRAAQLDPGAAMPHWGVALASGPHINMDLDGDVDLKAAYEATQRALALASRSSDHERAYIEAIATRSSKDANPDQKKLGADYTIAMAELVRRYPDDLDAATLYAESLMIPSRWRWFSADGKAAQGTTEAIAVLESVLRRDPLHAGANHFYIHAVESSLTPERALPSASRLMGVVPGVGHLVHMPGHIFLRTGDYESAAATNERAVQADREYMKVAGAGFNAYTLGYHPHNIHFIAVARAAQGRFDDAKRAADELAEYVAPGTKEMPMMVDYFIPMPLFVLLRFNRWDDVLKTKAPDSVLMTTTALWHFSRAVAFKAKGRSEEAAIERRAFDEAQKKIPADSIWANNRTQDLMGLAALVLEARLAGDDRSAIEHWKKAVAAQDGLVYDEPPAWYYPVRESLGGALLRSKRPAEAEAVFREDLRRNPRNGRSLFGLFESLKAQGKSSDAAWVGREFENAWKYAQVQLRIEDL